MGGFGIAVSFNGSGTDDRFPLLDRGLHDRGTAGLRHDRGRGFEVWEARVERDGSPGWSVETDHGITIVGDIRLWDRDELVHLAGIPIGEEVSDRALLVAAYRHVGPNMMRHVDGDFAFVIIDHRRGVVFGARDRFGARPLWYDASRGAVGMASEPGQLRTRASHPSVDHGEMRRYRDGALVGDDSSFLTGVRRLPPGHVIELTGTRTRVSRYWHLPDRDRRPASDPASAFRELLARSVARRLDSVTASHLSGGLDSSAIVVAASDLVEQGDLDADIFVTVSAVTPGRPTDETDRISALASSLPFETTTFEPQLADVQQLITDIAALDTPLVHPTRDLLGGSARACAARGASVLLTGTAGDEVVSDDRVLTEVLRTGHVSRWTSHVRTQGATDGDHWLAAAMTSSAPLLPRPLRRSIRRRLFADGGTDVPRSDALPLAGRHDRNRVRQRLAERLMSGQLVRSLELQEATYARAGIEVTHPFLDRHVVEYVATLPAARRPLGPGGKSITRAAFGDRLATGPGYDTKTRGDDLFLRSFEAIAPDLIARFPEVPRVASSLVDQEAYAADIDQLTEDPNLATQLRLWRTWTTFLWLTETTVAHAR